MLSNFGFVRDRAVDVADFERKIDQFVAVDLRDHIVGD
jgi:hypothetical protein